MRALCLQTVEGGLHPARPPPPFKTVPAASQHMNPVQAYHASIGFANGGGCARKMDT